MSPLKPPHVVTGGGATRKTTPSGSAHSENSGLTSSDERPLTQSQATPTSQGGMGVASRIRNFEQVGEGGRAGPFGGRTKSVDNEFGGAHRRGRGGRVTQALVAVQIGEEGERERVGEGDGGRRKREEEMRKLRKEEDRMQRERRPAEKSSKRNLEDDYENVDLGPPKATPTSKPTETTPTGRKKGAESGSTGYENVPLHYKRPPGGQRSPEPPKHGRGNSAQNSAPIKETHPHRVGGASSAGPSPKRHQYENITILTAAGPVPYHTDFSSSDDSEDFSGDESPAPREVIYENFGVDGGNQQMTVEEMERHLASREKRGVSAEYLRIKNEQLAHPYTACK